MSEAYDRVVAALRAHGCLVAHGCSVRADKARAKCPLHRDRRPSLVVTWDHRGAALFCHSCGRRGSVSIVEAIGLKMADLCETRWTGAEFLRIPKEVTRYVYRDLQGRLLAWKVRMSPKGFKWGRPDGHGGTAWNLRGVQPRLYRWPDLIDCQVVFLCEGEKSVDQLWDRGWPATCGPGGAGRWTPQCAQDLWTTGCRTLLVLPDNDRAGADHAELVASTMAAMVVTDPVQVRIVVPPGLLPLQNGVDWLEAGHSLEDLAEVANSAPVWTPTAAAEAAIERRRQLARDRQRRCRAARRVTLCMSEPGEPVTLRMSGDSPVTLRMSERSQPVTLSRVTRAHALSVHGKVLIRSTPEVRTDLSTPDLGKGVVEVLPRYFRSGSPDLGTVSGGHRSWDTSGWCRAPR
jgi:hypothetical protein